MSGVKKGATALIALLLLLELLIPPVWGHFIVTKIPGASDGSEATLSGRPALLWLGGEIPRVEILIPHLQDNRLALKEVRGVFEDVSLSPRQLMQRNLNGFSAAKTDISAVIGEEELVRLLSRPDKGIDEVNVDITAERIVAQGVFSPGGLLRLRLSLEGRLAVKEQGIVLQASKLMINNLDAGNLVWSALGEIPVVDARRLPLGLKVTRVEQEQGQARVTLHAGR